MNGIHFLATSLLCLATGAIIGWINPRRLINQVFVIVWLVVAAFIFCIYIAALFGTDDSSATSPVVWVRLSSAICAFIPYLLWLLKSALTGNHTSLTSLARHARVQFGASCLLSVLCFTHLFIPSTSTAANPQRGIGYFVFNVGLAVFFGALAVATYRDMKQSSGVRRIEMRLFLTSYCAGSILVVLLTLIGRALNIPAFRNGSPVIIIALCGLTIWAVSHYRIFDARQAMLLLGHRIAMLALLGAGAAGLTSLLSRIMPDPASLILGVIVAGVVVFYCDQRTRKWLGLNADHLLAEPRARIIGWARTESDPEKLRERFEDFLRHWCQTDRAELLVDNGNAYTGRRLAFANQGFIALCRQGWVTPEHLQRLPPDPVVVESLGQMSSQGLAAVLAVPRGSDCPSLLVALGPKHSLRPYTYPDIMLLLNLAELLDNILSHARLSAHAAKIARMEAFAMMSRGLAHDLSNLTTPVSTFLLHSEDRVEPGTPEAAVLADAKHSIKVMQDYIRESMFFSRRLVPQFTPVSTSEVLSSVIKSTRDRAHHHGVEVRVWTDESISFQADPALVQRLLQNLVFNGIDASGRGDVVELSAAAFDAHHVSLKVSDHGAGIPPETMEHIFEPYFTTKDTGDDIRGLGLGLAICRKIVDLHGGKIEVRANPGAGTTFAVILPMTPVNQPQSLPPAGAEPAAARRLFVPRTANAAGTGN